MMNPHPPLTWGQVKGWAEANGITDDHIVETTRGTIRDLSESELDDETPTIVLHTKWG